MRFWEGVLAADDALNSHLVPARSQMHNFSLRSKRLRGVWEQRTGFLVFFPREKWGESQKTKEGDGKGERKNIVLFPKLKAYSVNWSEVCSKVSKLF